MDTERIAVADGFIEPEETIDLSSDGGGGGDACAPPRALSWGYSLRAGGYHLLVVRADRTAVVAHLGSGSGVDGVGSGGGGGGGGGGGEGGSGSGSGEFVVKDVANGQRTFTAGCSLLQGAGRFALGTCDGDVELYDWESGGGGGGGLTTPQGVAGCPPQLAMTGEVEVRGVWCGMVWCGVKGVGWRKGEGGRERRGKGLGRGRNRERREEEAYE